MKKYTESGCIALVEAILKQCLTPTKNKQEIKERINFVNNSPIFDLYCIVADENKERTRKLVILRNHKFLANL